MQSACIGSETSESDTISTSVHTSVLPHIACASSPSQEKNERLICLALQSASSYCQRRQQNLEPQLDDGIHRFDVESSNQTQADHLSNGNSDGIKARLLAWANYVWTAVPIVSTSNKSCKNTQLELSRTCKIPHPVPPSERRERRGKTAREPARISFAISSAISLNSMPMRINCSTPSSTPLSSKIRVWS